MSIYLQEQNTKQLPLTVRTFETWSARTWLNKVQILLKNPETTRYPSKNGSSSRRPHTKLIS